MNKNSKLILCASMCLLALFTADMRAVAEEQVQSEDAPAADESAADDVSHGVKEFLSKTIGQPREQRLELARATIESTDATLEKEPLKANVRLLQVAALGAAARASTLGQSLKERYGSRSKVAVSDLLSIAPEEPWVLFFAGLWNMEVDRRGGVLGSALLGGSLEKGEKLVAEAMEKLPDEPSFHFAYAVVLVSIDAKKHAERARELLMRTQNLIKASRGRHALDLVMLGQSDEISLKLSTEDFDQARSLALNMM